MFILCFDCLCKVMDKSSVSFEYKHTYEVLLQNFSKRNSKNYAPEYEVLLQNFSKRNSKNYATEKMIALAELVLRHHDCCCLHLYHHQFAFIP